METLYNLNIDNKINLLSWYFKDTRKDRLEDNRYKEIKTNPNITLLDSLCYIICKESGAIIHENSGQITLPEDLASTNE